MVSFGEKYPYLVDEWSEDNPYTPFEVSYGSSGIVCSDMDNKKIEEEMQQLAKTIDDMQVVGDERISVVKTRINQSVFRERLIKKYGQCCLCGMSNNDLLIASHIKPWADSTPSERTDVENGLLLCPNHDRLFDKGFITFTDDGKIKISTKLSDEDRILTNVHKDMRINMPRNKFMKYHRNNIFEDSDKKK